MTTEPIPFNPGDAGEWLEHIFTTGTLLIDHPLDVSELNSSLVSLLQKPGWNKLAARITQNQNKDFFHLITPETFSNPVNFTSTIHDFPISSHPLASPLPTEASTLSIHPPLSEFTSLFQSPTCCKSIVDLL